MTLIALSILGLSEALSVVLCVAGGFALFPVALYASVAWEERGTRGWIPPDGAAWRDEFTHPDGHAHSGVILCDYVDEQRLASIARQKGVEAEPNKRERGSTTSRGGEVSAQTKGVSGLFRRNRTTETREYFDVEKDPNTALAEVLKRLEDEGKLNRDVADVPPLGMDDATLELLREAQPEVSTDTLRSTLIVAQKNRDWAALVEGLDDPFLLVESEWEVVNEGAQTVLQLQKLRPRYLAYDAEVPEEQAGVPVPDGLHLTVEVPEGATVGARLTGATSVRAGVLATIIRFDQGSGLYLRPIAVFSRHR